MADGYADLKQMLQQQLKLMEALTVKLSNSSMDQSSAACGSESINHITGSSTEFLYDPQAHITFDSWYKRYEDFFSVDLAAQDNAWMVRLLLRKLGPIEHERYAYLILSKNPRDIIFVGRLKTLQQSFGKQSMKKMKGLTIVSATHRECFSVCTADSIYCERFSQLHVVGSRHHECLPSTSWSVAGSQLKLSRLARQSCG
ncbi:unnamed protein product [Schistocephalus solidus]|uniref:DUF7083 domain-containing protein n=1 Tax=Schistocephalus solidus TaxID=70667 RepID=A0A183SHL9_SCHSO|nr:unnamed protein product [Schistocephalus solidus]